MNHTGKLVVVYAAVMLLWLALTVWDRNRHYKLAKEHYERYFEEAQKPALKTV